MPALPRSRWLLAAACLAAGLVASTTDARAADPAERTTLARQVAGGVSGGDYRPLHYARGRARIVRVLGARARAGRAGRQRSLLYLSQLTDAQLADEESPARAELLDRTDAGIFQLSWRPHEAFMPFVVDAAVRRVRQLRRSPVAQANGRRARMALLLTTGDMIDNKQRNELLWARTLLAGGRVDPDSGRPGGCAPRAPRGYTGVQDYDDPPAEDAFYDPDQVTGPWKRAGWPSYPGLMDRAQQPFRAAGAGIPSYFLLGNHDVLVQGETPALAALESLALGCVKPRSNDLLARILAGEDAATLAGLDGAMPVPSDPERRFLDKAEYQEVLAQGRQRDGHGFAYVDRAERTASNGAAAYYAWTPRPGIRFIALDVAPEGASLGRGGANNIDDPQWRWLQRELAAAERRDELTVVLSSSRPTGLDGTEPDEAAPRCAGPQRDVNPGCDRDPRDSRPLHGWRDLSALLLSHRHVLAYLSGGEHRIRPVRRPDGKGGFWAITTQQLSDYPHQGRLLELMDNRDGTLSLFTTTFDLAAPVVPPRPGTPAAQMTTAQLASLGRTFAANDPHAYAGDLGRAADQNVELLLRDPR